MTQGCADVLIQKQTLRRKRLIDILSLTGLAESEADGFIQGETAESSPTLMTEEHWIKSNNTLFM